MEKEKQSRKSSQIKIGCYTINYQITYSEKYSPKKFLSKLLTLQMQSLAHEKLSKLNPPSSMN